LTNDGVGCRPPDHHFAPTEPVRSVGVGSSRTRIIRNRILEDAIQLELLLAKIVCEKDDLVSLKGGGVKCVERETVCDVETDRLMRACVPVAECLAEEGAWGIGMWI